MASVEFPAIPSGPEAPKGAPAAAPPVVNEIPAETPQTPAVPSQVTETPAEPAKAPAAKSKSKAKAPAAPPEVSSEAPATAPQIPEPPKEPEPKYVIGKVTEDDMAKYSEEVASKGDLSPETLAELESKGIPSDMARAHVMTMKAHLASQRNEVLSVVGGEDSFKVISEWAVQNLDASQRLAFNEAAKQGNVGVLKTMLVGIKAQYEAVMGTQGGTLLRGSSPSAEAPFASRQEMIDAINNPKYRTDEAYRQRVAKRLAAGEIAY